MVLPVSDVQRSRDWYVGKLGFALERELEGAIGIKDRAGLTIFLIKSQGALTGQKITLTIQVDDVDREHQELVAAGVIFVSPPQCQFWGYGAEVLDPDGYMNHLWDEVTMRQVRQGREG
jgi:catechol 2,3-dioxygenase-like lactoylglutathione lyase family enzyme